jgi:Domain of Unknown Function (DUF1080)
LSITKRIAAGVAAASSLFLLLGTPAASAANLDLNETFEAHAVGTEWADGGTYGQWRSRFDGYGEVGVERAGSKVLSLKPKASTSAGETHAALVTTRKTFSNFSLEARAKTVKQLRTNNPNPWESAWVLWNYTDNTHFYYLALKPNGWELGKADPAYPGAQRFLATGSNMKFPVGEWADVEIKQVGRTMTVSANGQVLTTFTDNERPYTSGNVGLYNEDAKTYFDNVNVVGL